MKIINPNVQKEETNAALAYIDTDKSGTIDKEEFEYFLKKN